MRAHPDTSQTIDDAVVVMLGALGWIVADDARARRLLDVTGLSADTLRQGAGDPSMLAAIGGFLADHEPDLIACAAALDMPPASVVNAAAVLSRS
jgi:hypothetical protein